MGVLLELARVIVANPSVQLAAPVIVLLNGAEETFLQARDARVRVLHCTHVAKYCRHALAVKMILGFRWTCLKI